MSALDAYRTLLERARAADATRPWSVLQHPLLIAIVLLALALRTYVALTTTHIWDEDRDWILMAQRISFDPSAPYLPIRSFNHGALPAYFIKLGTFLFGENPLGFRFAGLIAGTVTIGFVALIAHAWAGRTAALWAAAFVGFNEFHGMVSIIATDKVFSICFASIAAYCFVRALSEDRPRWLLGAAVAAALSILCYEIMYLLIPIFAIAVVFSKRRVWFCNPYLYAAAALGAVVLMPDLLWNLSAPSEGEMSYEGHLERFGGIGFNRQYLFFFFRDAAQVVYDIFDRQLPDGFGEYATMNVLLGTMLFGAAMWWSWRFATSREHRADPVPLFLLASFWLMFGLFSVIEPGTSTRLDNSGWPWVQYILIPCAVLAAATLEQLKGVLRLAATVLAAISVSFGALNIAVERFKLESYGVWMTPDSDIGGDTISYRAVFHPCMVCDPEPQVELTAIVPEDPDWADYTPFGPSDMIGVEFNTPDREFALRHPRWRSYEVHYRVTERSGRTHSILIETWRDLLEFPPPSWCENC